MTAKLLVAVMALGLVAAACSSNDSGSGGGGSSTGASGTTGSTGSTGSTGTTGSTGSSGGGGGTKTATVTIKDFAFDPDQITGIAGSTLTITVTNNDSTEHSFTVDDNEAESEDIQPGDTQTIKVALPDSGTVGWHCRFHPTMTGTITVG